MTRIECKPRENGSYPAGVTELLVRTGITHEGSTIDNTIVREIICRLRTVETHRFSKHHFSHIISLDEIKSAWGVIEIIRDPNFIISDGSYEDFQKRYATY